MATQPLVGVIILLSVVQCIYSQPCPPSSGKAPNIKQHCIIVMYIHVGIYLMHRGNCYSNVSYVWDTSMRPDPLECALPGATLNGGQWIGPNGEVPCPGNNSNLLCTVGSGASLSVHIPISNELFLEPSGDGWYMCCLPTSCSDPNTNIIFVNLFSK